MYIYIYIVIHYYVIKPISNELMLSQPQRNLPSTCQQWFGPRDKYFLLSNFRDFLALLSSGSAREEFEIQVLLADKHDVLA